MIFTHIVPAGASAMNCRYTKIAPVNQYPQIKDRNQHRYLQARMVFPGKKTTPFVGIYNELKNVIHVLVKQNLKDWKIIDIVLFLFNVEIVFIKKKK